MITTSISRKIAKFNLALILLGWLYLPSIVEAQNSLTLSVSPATYELSVNPGQQLNSSIRIINPNPFDLTVYAEVVNFRPRGEGGEALFNPIDPKNDKGATLAEWFRVSGDPIIIPREQSTAVPFSIEVPADASPGGHFAAIMIGTRPLRDETGVSRIQTAQIVTSLVFLRVAGDVIESGLIREFTTTRRVYSEPAAEFSLRFENRGNVHIRPEGEIRILNMWGNERGIIPINQLTGFGNVLPDSIRQFRFTWKGEWSPSDIGRYTALVTVAYGTEERQSAFAEIDFWVLPLDLIAKTILATAVLIFLVIWLIKLYVRRMLRLAGISVETLERRPVVVVDKPAGLILNLRQQLPTTDRIAGALATLRFETAKLSTQFSRSKLKAIFQFLIASRLWLLTIPVLVIIMLALWYLLSDAKQTDFRAFEVGYINPDQTVTVTSEEIVYNRLRAQSGGEPPVPADNQTPIDIVNRGGVPGRGAEVKIALESAGYTVRHLKADFTEQNPRTVIIANQKHNELALELSRLLNNALISFSDEVDAGAITIYVGAENFTF